MKQQSEYIEAQLAQLPDASVYKMQVTGCGDQGESGRTKWLNISKEQLEKIREILVEAQS
jgi:hypothetical protein